MRRDDGSLFWMLVLVGSMMAFTAIAWMSFIAVTAWALRWMGLV